MAEERRERDLILAPNEYAYILDETKGNVANKLPTPGAANSLPALDIGHKINIPGPVAFAPWPGQMVQVLQGHRLRSNQYLVVRVYDEEAARNNALPPHFNFM